MFMRLLISFLIAAQFVCCQSNSLAFLNGGGSLLDAHNCYPYEGKWADRIDRALQTGTPLGIEQDLAWHLDPSTGKGRIVVSHSTKTSGAEPTLKQHFFERVRPLIEKALRDNDRRRWPLIVLHFDFKGKEAALFEAVWDLLGEYEPWITTAVKTADASILSPFEPKPLLVLTEDSDAHEQVFFNRLAIGAKMRIFGSAHTAPAQGKDEAEKYHWAATASPAVLLAESATNYRRWWNLAWSKVEEGGQRRAGDWTASDNKRLRDLVDHAHKQGLWIRFYTLDGFTPDDSRGWDAGYNFGSHESVRLRWKASIDAGVDLIATDQYEEFAAFMRQNLQR